MGGINRNYVKNELNSINLPNKANFRFIAGLNLGQTVTDVIAVTKYNKK